MQKSHCSELQHQHQQQAARPTLFMVTERNATLAASRAVTCTQSQTILQKLPGGKRKAVASWMHLGLHPVRIDELRSCLLCSYICGLHLHHEGMSDKLKPSVAARSYSTISGLGLLPGADELLEDLPGSGR